MKGAVEQFCQQDSLEKKGDELEKRLDGMMLQVVQQHLQVIPAERMTQIRNLEFLTLIYSSLHVDSDQSSLADDLGLLKEGELPVGFDATKLPSEIKRIFLSAMDVQNQKQ